MKTILPERVIDTSHTEDENELKRSLNATDLVLLGVGTVVGAGIFVLTGIAAATKAGPAIILSYIIAAIACGFSALSYAELAASVGGCGSAYGYSKESFGIKVAWFIGWALLLEYGIACSAVAVGWSGYLNILLQSIGVHLPTKWINPPSSGGIIDLPAVIIISLIGMLLVIGTKTSARLNKVMVVIKFVIIGIFIYITAQHINFSYWRNFMPFGWHGVMSGAGFIFFAYIGFDAVSTAAQETVNPQRNLPIGIIGTLIICTILYIIVSGLLTLVVPYNTLNVSSPIAQALMMIGYHIGAMLVAIGTIVGLTTVIIAMYYGLTRIVLAMSRDHLFPRKISVIHPKTKTPVRIIGIVWIAMTLASSFVSLDNLVAIVNIGTLFAFTAVCAGVTVFHFTRPNMPRPFKTPGKPIIPILGVISCVYLATTLPEKTWERFAIWMLLGLFVFIIYGSRQLKKLRIKEKSL